MKAKARSPILKGFGLYFSAVLKFTGQQYFLSCVLRQLPTAAHRNDAQAEESERKAQAISIGTHCAP